MWTVGCVNTFVGAAAYGIHPKVFGTPVTRQLTRSPMEEIRDVRKEAASEGAEAEERHGLATPRGADDEEEEEAAPSYSPA